MANPENNIPQDSRPRPAGGEPESNVIPPARGGGGGGATTAVLDPEEVFSPDELAAFQRAAEAERRRIEDEQTRDALYLELGAMNGLEPDQARKVYKKIEREKAREKAAEAKRAKAKRKKEEKQRSAADKAEEKKAAARAREKRRRRERGQRQVTKAAGKAAANLVGSSSGSALMTDFILLASTAAVFGVAVVFLPPIRGFVSGVGEVISDVRGSKFAEFMGLGAKDSAQPGAGGAIQSPLAGVSLQELVDYEPTHGQSFGLKTGNLRDYDGDGVAESPHGGVDFDGTAGGYAGNKVLAVEDAEVVAVDDLCGDGSAFRIIYRAARPTVLDEIVFHRAVHVSNPTVKVGDQITAGQEIATVAPKDCVSTGPHYDHKITIGSITGEWYDPQEYFAAGVEKAVVIGEIPDFAFKLIQEFEGFHSKPYWDYAQYSYGFGTRAPCNTEAECASVSISREAAKQEMAAFLEATCAPLIQSVEVYDDMTQGQQAAFYSLCYNLGGGQFSSSDAYKTLQAGDVIAACGLFDLYVKAEENGVMIELAGLSRRRNREQEYCGVEMPWND